MPPKTQQVGGAYRSPQHINAFHSGAPLIPTPFRANHASIRSRHGAHALHIELIFPPIFIQHNPRPCRRLLERRALWSQTTVREKRYTLLRLERDVYVVNGKIAKASNKSIRPLSALSLKPRSLSWCYASDQTYTTGMQRGIIHRRIAAGSMITTVPRTRPQIVQTARARFRCTLSASTSPSPP